MGDLSTEEQQGDDCDDRDERDDQTMLRNHNHIVREHVRESDARGRGEGRGAQMIRILLERMSEHEEGQGLAEHALLWAIGGSTG
jgi:hypothetical protein